MPSTLTSTEALVQPVPGESRFDPPSPPVQDDGGGAGPYSNQHLVQRYKLGVWVGICGIVMFFAAMTSAMVVRQGLSDDWQVFRLPPILFVSTAVLLLSSWTIERSRKAIKLDLRNVQRWVNASALLGLVFLACQVLGWQALTERGIYLASNPANSFYYVLTAGHGVHLLGGVVVLGYIWFRVRNVQTWNSREAVLEAAALYWHFMDVLWIYILGLLFFWR